MERREELTCQLWFDSRSFYLCAIINCSNDLRTIQILESSFVPIFEVSFTCVPLPSLLFVTAVNLNGKDDFTLCHSLYIIFPRFILSPAVSARRPPHPMGRPRRSPVGVTGRLWALAWRSPRADLREHPIAAAPGVCRGRACGQRAAAGLR